MSCHDSPYMYGPGVWCLVMIVHTCMARACHVLLCIAFAFSVFVFVFCLLFCCFFAVVFVIVFWGFLFLALCFYFVFALFCFALFCLFFVCCLFVFVFVFCGVKVSIRVFLLGKCIFICVLVYENCWQL